MVEGKCEEYSFNLCVLPLDSFLLFYPFAPFGLNCRAELLHGVRMTLMKIEEARRALEELKTDEAELSRLHADQLAGIQALKDGGSKDFVLLTDLEAKRTALATLLSDQRSRVANAAGQLTALETKQRKAGQLADLRSRVAGLRARKQETDSLLIELGAFLSAHLARIIAARLTWCGELQGAVAITQDVYGLASLELADQNNGKRRAAWRQAFAEIGPGAAEALTLLPTTKFAQGLQQLYSRPNARQNGQGIDVAMYAASSPLLWYLDRPVTLTIAEAVETANLATPEHLQANERAY